MENARSDEDPLERFEPAPAISIASFIPSLQQASSSIILSCKCSVSTSPTGSTRCNRDSWGYKWPKEVERFWNPVLDKICETCVHKLFKDRLARKVRREYLLEVGDSSETLKKMFVSGRHCSSISSSLRC